MNESADEGGAGDARAVASRSGQGERPAEVDGRRLRRDRNRDAVLESLIDLIEGGELDPTVAAIAERSSVSLRSVFRYFDDRDGLLEEATELAFRRYAPLSVIHGFGEGTLSERIDAITDQRLRIFPAIGPVVRAARLRGSRDPAVVDAVNRLLRPLHEQVEHQFADELSHCGSDREPVAAGLDLLLSLETFELLTRTQGRPTHEVRRVYRVTIESLLLPIRDRR